MPEYNLKNVLVTGGAGFIGCNYIRHLLATDKAVRVINLDLLTYAGSLENLSDIADNSRYRFIHGNICDRDLVNKILREHAIDTVVHFAAESHVDRSIAGPEIFIQTNVLGTFTLLEAAKCFWLDELGMNKSNCRFHHISTDEVYGSLGIDDLPFTENTAYAPNSPYSASKASSDHLVRSYYETFELPITITQCSNNYGPYQHLEKFIPTIIRCCLNKQSIPIYGDGKNIRDWLHVSDHCRAIDLVIRKGSVGENYNIGANCEKENLDVVKFICDRMDQLNPKEKPHSELIHFVSDRKGHDRRYAINNKKIRALGWVNQIDFSKGISEALAWYSKEVVYD